MRTVRSTPFGLEFSTERDLTEREGWLIFDETQAPLVWEPNLQATEFQQVKINGKLHEIKHQEKASDDWQHLTLEHSKPKTVEEGDKLEIDGLEFSAYDWELVPQGNAFGPMKDDVRQITNVVQLNQNVLVEGLPSGNTSTIRTGSSTASRRPQQRAKTPPSKWPCIRKSRNNLMMKRT